MDKFFDGITSVYNSFKNKIVVIEFTLTPTSKDVPAKKKRENSR